MLLQLLCNPCKTLFDSNIYWWTTVGITTRKKNKTLQNSYTCFRRPIPEKSSSTTYQVCKFIEATDFTRYYQFSIGFPREIEPAKKKLSVTTTSPVKLSRLRWRWQSTPLSHKTTTNSVQTAAHNYSGNKKCGQNSYKLFHKFPVSSWSGWVTAPAPPSFSPPPTHWQCCVGVLFNCFCFFENRRSRS